MKFLAALRAWCGDHKKLTATIVGAAIALIPDTVLDADRKKWVVGMIITYVAGQGIADNGKEAVKAQGKVDEAARLGRLP